MRWFREVGEALHGECLERLDRNRRPHGYSGVRTTEIEGIPLSLSVGAFGYWLAGAGARVMASVGTTSTLLVVSDDQPFGALHTPAYLTVGRRNCAAPAC